MVKSWTGVRPDLDGLRLLPEPPDPPATGALFQRQAVATYGRCVMASGSSAPSLRIARTVASRCVFEPCHSGTRPDVSLRGSRPSAAITGDPMLHRLRQGFLLLQKLRQLRAAR